MTMSRRDLLGQPHFEPFLANPWILEVPDAALHAFDDALKALRDKAAPAPGDLVGWATGWEPEAPEVALNNLVAALEMLAPENGPFAAIAAARNQVVPAPDMAVAKATAGSDVPEKTCSPSIRRRNPKISCEEAELPEEWRAALEYMQLGLPQNGVQAPADGIRKRIAYTLCQYTVNLRAEGLEPAFSLRAIDISCVRQRARLETRKYGLRWASLLRHLTDIETFLRYIGSAPDIVAALRPRMRWLEEQVNTQTQLKYRFIEEADMNTRKVIDLAHKQLSAAAHEPDPEVRHQMRNAACILNTYAQATIRRSDTVLIFGRDLLWRPAQARYVVNKAITKTRASNPKRFVFPLLPVNGAFIDAVILQDADPAHLPKLRAAALRSHRPLIVHFDGRAASSEDIAAIFHEATGVAIGAARTMLHTDQGVRNGATGTRRAMIAAHQSDVGTAAHYQAESVAMADMHEAQAQLLEALAEGFEEMSAPELDEAFAALDAFDAELKEAEE